MIRDGKEAPQRIATLDILRGVAVMGILALNIIGFAMPDETYLNPLAYGLDGNVGMVSWALTFILIDGKMRGLFSFLFGASMLLVIQKAEAKGESPVSVHFRRMLWLLLFGLLHFYFIWSGDVLSVYAMIGMIAWFFRKRGAPSLIRLGTVFLILQMLIFTSFALYFFHVSQIAAAPGADPETVRHWASMQEAFSVPTGARLADSMALYGGSWLNLARHQLTEQTFDPMVLTLLYGWETLAYMLFGMAALQNRFFTGGWSNERYRRIVKIGLGITIPVYTLLALLLWHDGFSTLAIVSVSRAATVPFRPIMVAAVAALIILLTRRAGAFVQRIAAVGRAAFTNYLGTSILMTALFYGWGFGLFGHLNRIQLWIPVVATWAVMLLWSKPWLDRFNYGPFEWLWRSLARWRLQPMRRPALKPAAA